MILLLIPLCYQVAAPMPASVVPRPAFAMSFERDVFHSASGAVMQSLGSSFELNIVERRNGLHETFTLPTSANMVRSSHPARVRAARGLPAHMPFLQTDLDQWKHPNVSDKAAVKLLAEWSEYFTQHGSIKST